MEGLTVDVLLLAVSRSETWLEYGPVLYDAVLAANLTPRRLDTPAALNCQTLPCCVYYVAYIYIGVLAAQWLGRWLLVQRVRGSIPPTAQHVQRLISRTFTYGRGWFNGIESLARQLTSGKKLRSYILPQITKLSILFRGRQIGTGSKSRVITSKR